MIHSLRGQRILLPVHHFPPRFNAGAENYTLGLAKGLIALGWAGKIPSVLPDILGPLLARS